MNAAAKHENMQNQLQQLTERDWLALTNSWMDPGMSAVFKTGSILYIMQYIQRSLVSSQLTNIFGAGWNVFDAVGSYLAAAEGIKNLENAKRRHAEKKAWIGVDLFMSTQLLATTGLSLSAQYGLVTGMAGAVFTSLAGFGFAACMWAAVARSIVELHHAIQKTSIGSLFEDRIIKLKYLQDKVVDDEDRLKHLKELTRVEHQLGAIYRTKWLSHHAKFNKILADHPNVWNYNPNKTATPEDWALIDELVHRQKDKIIEKSFQTAFWLLAAVGMTFMALAVFCPFLLLPGIILVAVSSGLRTGQWAAPKIANGLAKKQLENIMKDNGEISDSDDDRIRMAWKLSDAEEQGESLEAFKGEVNNLTKFQRWMLLRAAYKKNTR